MTKVASLVVCVVLFGAAMRGDDSLKGLPGVAVLVEPLSDAVEKKGLRRSDIQTDVELALRQSGIRVFNLIEVLLPAEGPAPMLYVQMGAIINEEQTGLVYTISVEVRQRVTLASGEKAFGAATWKTGSFGLVGPSSILTLRGEVKNHIDEFLNAWLTANPKQ